MDIERLREFLTIVNEGSFRRAAEKLQVSPSVLSARFQGFERSMGAVLLERNNHWVKPTEQGQALIRQGVDLLTCWEHTAKKLDAMKNREASSLAIQLCGQTMPSELGIYLDIYARSHPRLFLNLYDDNSFMVRDGLSSGNVDITFVPGLEHDFEDIPGRVAMAHFHHIHVHVANDHPLAGNGKIRFKDLEDETIILYPSMLDPFVRELQMKLIQRSGIHCKIYPGLHNADGGGSGLRYLALPFVLGRESKSCRKGIHRRLYPFQERADLKTSAIRKENMHDHRAPAGILHSGNAPEFQPCSGKPVHLTVRPEPSHKIA